MTYLMKNTITGEWYVLSRKQMSVVLRMKKRGVMFAYKLYHI